MFKSLIAVLVLSFALVGGAMASTYGIVGKLQHKNDYVFGTMMQEFRGEIRSTDETVCNDRLHAILAKQVYGGASANDPATFKVVPSVVAHTLQCVLVN